MPRLEEAKKDVLDCDKLGGAVKKHWYQDFRMGQPNMVRIILPAHIYLKENYMNYVYLIQEVQKELYIID